MSFAAQPRQRSTPILPLAGMVDVLFLLLIFFMTASIFRDQALQIDIALTPTQSAQPGDDTPTHIVVNVTADNRVFVGQRQVEMDQLHTTFVQLVEQFPHEAVEVRGDKNADFGVAVQVMDLAQLAGISNISVATIKSTQELD